jgi:hypothetical protein
VIGPRKRTQNHGRYSVYLDGLLQVDGAARQVISPPIMRPVLSLI